MNFKPHIQLDCFKSIGKYFINWNSKNNQGKIVSSGLYFFKIQLNSYEVTKKMLLIK